MSDHDTICTPEDAKKLLSEERRVERRQKYYYQNIESERQKARERAAKRRAANALETPEEAETRKKKHREHQALYRNANKERIRNDRFFERQGKKYRLALAKAAAEKTGHQASAMAGEASEKNAAEPLQLS